jgi:hypothetical protein
MLPVDRSTPIRQTNQERWPFIDTLLFVRRYRVSHNDSSLPAIEIRLPQFIRSEEGHYYDHLMRATTARRDKIDDMIAKLLVMWRQSLFVEIDELNFRFLGRLIDTIMREMSSPPAT